ncbi:MAG: FIST N-terminal domain-containing protein [Myxococcota bacterium]
MTSACGSGASQVSNPNAAVEQALAQARASLGGHAPTLGLLFCSPKLDLNAVLEAAAAQQPGAQFIGCTTAGEFTERGRTDGGLSAFLLAHDDALFDVRVAAGIAEDVAASADTLAQGYARIADEAVRRGASASTTLTLVDGLCAAGERLTNELRRATRPFQQVIGGAAGDDAAFAQTLVGRPGEVLRGGAVVAHVFDHSNWGVGMGHGLSPDTDRMTVTRAEGNVVYEIDDRPAFDVYLAHAARNGKTLTPQEAPGYMVQYEIGVYFFDELRFARAPLGVGADGSLTLAGDLPKGSTICLLDGERPQMLKAAREAAQEAKRGLAGADAAGVLVFDCVCRGQLLAEDFGREIDAVRDVFGDVPVSGFLTYGEIARYRGKLQGWNNATAVVLAIPRS